MSTAASIQERARAARERLWNPPGGYLSSELDVVSLAEMRVRRLTKARKLALIDRNHRRLVFVQTAIKATPKPTYAQLPTASEVPGEPTLSDDFRPSRVTVREIVRATCRHYQVALSDVMSARRTASIVRPRQVAMYLAKELTLRSLPEIGRLFERDHTTVLHAVRRIADLLGDEQVQADLLAIRMRLNIAQGRE